MQDFQFLSGGRILAGAGSGDDVILLNCFVIATIEDSTDAFMRAADQDELWPLAFPEMPNSNGGETIWLGWPGEASAVRCRLVRRVPARDLADVLAGSISLLAGAVSSGIEPIFAADYRRAVPGPDGATASPTLTDDAVRLWREQQDRLDGAPDALVTAAELPPEAHLAMQAALQPRVDNVISKTVNLSAATGFSDSARFTGWPMKRPERLHGMPPGRGLPWGAAARKARGCGWVRRLRLISAGGHAPPAGGLAANMDRLLCNPAARFSSSSCGTDYH